MEEQEEQEEQGSPTREERSRRRNVTLDWQGIDFEKRRCLKQTRGSCKRVLTMAMSKADKSLLFGNSVEEVTAMQGSLDEAFEKFKNPATHTVQLWRVKMTSMKQWPISMKHK